MYLKSTYCDKTGGQKILERERERQWIMSFKNLNNMKKLIKQVFFGCMVNY